MTERADHIMKTVQIMCAILVFFALAGILIIEMRKSERAIPNTAFANKMAMVRESTSTESCKRYAAEAWDIHVALSVEPVNDQLYQAVIDMCEEKDSESTTGETS